MDISTGQMHDRLISFGYMKKFLSFCGLCAFGLAVAVSAQAALPPVGLTKTVTPTKISPVIIQPTTTAPIAINPNLKATLPTTIIDPSLQVVDPSMPTPKPLPIDPIKLGGMQIIPITPIVIPPALLKGPAITNIITSSDLDSLRIQWTTDKPATTLVDYGPTDAYGKSLGDKTLVTAHDVLLAAQPGQTVHVRLTSLDSLNRKTSTSDVTIVIPPFVQQPAATSTAEVQPPTQTPTTTQVQPEKKEPVAVVQDKTTQTDQSDANEPSDNSTLIAVLIGVVAILAIVVIVLLVRKPKQGPQPKV